MTEQLPEYRPDIWSGVEGGKIRNTFVENGYGETIRTVDALRSIDTRALARVAVSLYGTSRSYTHERIAAIDPEVAADNNAYLPSRLQRLGQDAERRFMSEVSDNWTGDAFEEARRYTYRLNEVTRLEADRSAVVGDAILDFSVAVEEAVGDAEEVVLGAANLLWAEIGLGTSLVSGGIGGVMMSAAGLIASISGEVMGQIERRQLEVDETTLATMNLQKPGNVEKVRGVHPEDLMPQFPDDREGWELS